MVLKTAPMVEREKYINQIPAILANLIDGKGAVVAIMGEPGIGKTRLSQEMRKIAGEHGCQILFGRSYSVAKDTAYASIIEMFLHHFRGVKPDKIESWTKDLPDLGKLFRRLNLPEPPKIGDPALEKTRLFESLACLAERMSEGQPLVIIQEDLHFADPASLEFLHYMSRGMNRFPLVLVFTIDKFELSDNEQVKELIQSLRKEDQFQQFHLSRLSEQGVTQLLTDRLDAPLPDGLIPVVLNHSEGVPLFIDELLHSLLETGKLSNQGGVWIFAGNSIETIPYRMKELMKDRIQRIQSKDQRVLLFASIAEGTVSHRILHRLTQMSEDDFLAAIQRLKASGLLYEEIRDLEVFYGIYHALIKDVVCEELPIMVRRRAYLQFIEAMEESGCDNAEQLAHLYYGAGSEADPVRTVSVFLKEAERGFQLYAYSSAVKYYESSLRIIRANKRSIEANRIPWILKRLGEAHQLLGERSEAKRYALEAISAYVPSQNSLEIARLHGLLSVIYWESGEIEQSLRHLDEGLAIARKEADGNEVRYSLLHTGLTFLSRLKRPEEYYQVYEEIQVVHRLIGTPSAAAQAKVAEIDYWTSCVYKENYEPGKVQLLIEELVSMDVEDLPLLRGCYVSAINFVICGQHEQSLVYSRRAMEIAKRIRVLEYEIPILWIQVLADLQSGQWKLAWTKVENGMSKARKIDLGRPLIYAHITKAITQAWMGHFGDAQQCLEEMRELIPVFPGKDGHLIDMLAPIEMMIAVGMGKALDYYESMNRTRPYYVTLHWLSIALWGEIQLAAGDREGALRTVGELQAGEKEDHLFAWALGQRLSGKAVLASGDREASTAHFAEAARSFEQLNMPLEYARCLLLHAEALAEDGPDEAKSHLLRCMELFEHLEAENDLIATQALMKRLGVRLPKSGTSGAGKMESELSKRELEVARLVAEGLTNNEIAETLIISPRTVSTHLEKIYRRLGISSRASLVKFLMET